MQKTNERAVYLFLTGVMVAAFVSFFTMRPDLFWICTIISILGFTSVITKGNSITSSMTVAAFPIYIILIIITLPVEVSYTGDMRLIGESIASISFHFINFTLILYVMIKYWERTVPKLIFFTSIFYTLYIPAFIIAVKIEHGAMEPYHALFIDNAIFFIPFNILVGLFLSWSIFKSKTGVKKGKFLL